MKDRTDKNEHLEREEMNKAAEDDFLELIDPKKEEFGALEDQGTHTYTLGKKGVVDIGHLVATALGDKLRRLDIVVGQLKQNQNLEYWQIRVTEVEHEIKELKAYNNMFLGAKSITIEHLTETEIGKE